jgi:hypothetical protein
MQTELYSRFLERLTDVGARGELDAVRELWAQQEAEKQAIDSTGQREVQPLEAPNVGGHAAAQTVLLDPNL